MLVAILRREILLGGHFCCEQTQQIWAKRAGLSARATSVQTDNRGLVYPLVGRELDGKPATVEFTGQPLPTVVYIFSPTCHFCEANAANFAAIYKSAEHSHRFVGVATSTAGLRCYLAENAMTFQVLTGVRKGSWSLGATPQMVVVSRDGALVRNWVGVPDSKRWELESYFGVTLPGLRGAGATPLAQ